MFKKKLLKILSLSLSLSIASMGFAFADTNKNMDEPVSIEVTAVDEELYAKQAEIDKLLFEEYAKDLEEKDVFITHTGVSEGYIEVGITPYTPENADILAKLLADDTVNVVEGMMAVTLEYNPELNDKNPDPRVVMDPSELADYSQIVGETEEDVEEAGVVSAPVDSEAEDLADDAKIINAPIEEEKGVSPIVIAVGAVAAIVLGAVLFKKKTAQ